MNFKEFNSIHRIFPEDDDCTIFVCDIDPLPIIGLLTTTEFILLSIWLSNENIDLLKRVVDNRDLIKKIFYDETVKDSDLDLIWKEGRFLMSSVSGMPGCVQLKLKLSDFRR
jgi:hypothetical protein